MKYQFYRIELHCAGECETHIVFKDEKNNFEEKIDMNMLPTEFAKTTTVKAWYRQGSEERHLEFTLADWIVLQELGEKGFVPSDVERLGDTFFGAEIPFEDLATESKVPMPLMSLEDITEREFFNFHPISQGLLDDANGGLWAYQGKRKFSFHLSEIPFALHKKEEVKMKLNLYFSHQDNDILEEQIQAESPRVMDLDADAEEGCFEIQAVFDTNLIGETFTTNNKFHRFKGCLEVVCRTIDEDFGENTVIYAFPFFVIFHNTNFYAQEKIPCAVWDKNTVSIDFGTSSTCVAVWKGKNMELLTTSSQKLLEDNENYANINIYENPTNLMIYDWEQIYEEWCNDSQDIFPNFKHGSYDQYHKDNKRFHYDAGYTVREALGSGNRTAMNAILTEIKMIAYHLDKGDELKVFPIYKEEVSTVNLVSSHEDEDKESLDAVAFYAYLLGRAINDPASGKIYTKFGVTYPVKFNKNVRKKMLKSLEYGLRRSVPLPLRDALDAKGKPLFQVSMEYSEPVAFVGSVCGNHLKATPTDPALFAVYDFGGGTLDFAFGMFSVDEDDLGTISIYGIDGDSDVGGETLISRISYWIYSENLAEMKNLNIPFERPEQEKIPDDFPIKLLNKTNIAKANVVTLNEAISRSLFQNQQGELDGGKEPGVESCLLRNEANEEVQVELNVDFGLLADGFRGIIEKTIHHFEITMEKNFISNETAIAGAGGSYDKNKVTIFKAGNSSRCKFVGDMMETYFPENEVYLVDETEVNVNKKYAINPKTAVAFGQLRLRNFELELAERPPFAWNIYKESMGDATFKAVLEKNTKETGWVSFGLVRRNVAEIYCSDTIVNDRSDPHFPMEIEGPEEAEDWGKTFIFLRVHDETSVEYHFTESKAGQDCPITPNTDNVLVISN